MTSFSRLHFKTLVNKLPKVLCIDGEFEKKEMKRTMGGEYEVKRGNKWGNFGEESKPLSLSWVSERTYNWGLNTALSLTHLPR